MKPLPIEPAPASPARAADEGRASTRSSDAPARPVPDAGLRERMKRAVHDTECGYASHIGADDEDDPDPCGAKADRLLAALAAHRSSDPSPAPVPDHDCVMPSACGVSGLYCYRAAPAGPAVDE